jgi:hypothetical protein
MKSLLLSTNYLNSNGRIYPKSVVEEAINKPEFQEKLKSGKLLGTVGQSLEIDPSQVSHVTTNVFFEGDSLYGEIEFLDTPLGRDMEKLVTQGTRIQLALRGIGDGENIDGSFKVTELDILSFDWVAESTNKKEN